MVLINSRDYKERNVQSYVIRPMLLASNTSIPPVIIAIFNNFGIKVLFLGHCLGTAVRGYHMRSDEHLADRISRLPVSLYVVFTQYGAVSGSKVRGHLFGMMLRHNDTTLWPVSKALRHSYTTFSLHNLMFWLYSWAVRRNDVTFRLYYMTFRRQSRRSVIMNCRTIVTRGKKVKNRTRCSSCTLIQIYV